MIVLRGRAAARHRQPAAGDHRHVMSLLVGAVVGAAISDAEGALFGAALGWLAMRSLPSRTMPGASTIGSPYTAGSQPAAMP